jgi:UDP-glucose 4-epimerase
MKRAVVTGATGFVGANVARGLLDRGCEVHLLVRPGHQSWRLEGIQSRVRVHEANLTDGPRVATVFNEVRPDWVFHLAAHGAYSNQTDTRQMVATNLLATIEVLSAALAVGFESFVAAGSSSEYGLKDHAPTEDEVLEPNSDYAVTKAAATLYCSHVGRQSGANITTLRLYSTYGPWEEPARFIPALAAHGLSGSWPPLASPNTARDFVYVDDVVDAFILAAAHGRRWPGAIFNIGAGSMTTLGAAVDAARRILSIEAQPKWNTMDDRSWDTTIWLSDSRRARATLGWEPRYTFEQGFQAFLDWLGAHPELADRYGVGRSLAQCG